VVDQLRSKIRALRSELDTTAVLESEPQQLLDLDLPADLA
jgi:hypothetical protein